MTCMCAFHWHAYHGRSRRRHRLPRRRNITSSEAFAFSIAAIMADVIRGRICDFGFASAVQNPSPILTDNDAVKRIASNAGSAKRSLMVLRRLAFVLHLMEQGEIIRST